MQKKANKRRVDDPKLVMKRLPLLIDAAIDQFGHNGFHATTIQDVSRHAGISIGMVYQYVSDKEELLYLSIIEIVEHHIREIGKALEGAHSPLERFVALVDALTRVIDARRPAAVLGYRESHSMSREHIEYVKKREREIGDTLSDCINECIRAGVFRKIDVQMLTYQCIIFAHNWALNSWRFTRPISVDTYIKEGLSLLTKPVLVDFDSDVPARKRLADVKSLKARTPGKLLDRETLGTARKRD
jgi:AcrR family transcriptional regulator